MKDFSALFVDELKEMYGAESVVSKILSGAIDCVKSPQLKECLQTYLEDTQRQLHRLEQTAKELGENFSRAECEPMNGLFKEFHRIAKTQYQGETKDCAIVSLLQKIKHYEIASYGTLRTFARHLRQHKIEAWLKESAHEEGIADKYLTELAEGTILNGGLNTKACRKSA